VVVVVVAVVVIIVSLIVVIMRSLHGAILVCRVMPCVKTRHTSPNINHDVCPHTLQQHVTCKESWPRARDVSLFQGHWQSVLQGAGLRLSRMWIFGTKNSDPGKNVVWC